MRLVRSFEKFFLKFYLRVVGLQLFFELVDLSQQSLVFLLLGLQAVGQQQALLDSSLSSSRCLGNGGDQCTTDGILAAVQGIVAISHVHDGRVELLLDELVGHESLLEDSVLRADVRCALPVQPFELVVLSPQYLLLLPVTLQLQSQVLHLLQVVLVQVAHTLKLI